MKKKVSRVKMSTTIWSFIFSLTILGFYWLSVSFTTITLPSSEHPAELYSTQTQNDLRMTFIHAIEEARKSIYLSIYTLTDPYIIDALKQKRKEGIQVTVIYDAKASEGVHSKLGADVRTIARNGPGLMHLKILVIDELKCWIGSANFTPTSLRSHGNLVAGFHSQELAQILCKKAECLAQEGKIEPVNHCTFNINGQNLEMWFLPENKEAISRIKQLIRTAEKTIKVAMFTWTRYDLANEIIEAKNRGVDVQVVIDRNSGQGVSACITNLLQSNNVNIRLSQGSALLHHKFMIVDEKILVNGSANWTKAAFNQNDDCFIVLHPLTEEQKQLLTQLWEITILESEEKGKDLAPASYSKRNSNIFFGLTQGSEFFSSWRFLHT